MPRAPLAKTPRGSSGSLFSRAINSLISIEGADAGAAEHASAREAAAAAAAAESAEACRVDEIVGDSKFLVRLRFFLMPATTMLRLPILYFCCACFVRALPPAACCAAFPADRSAVGSHNLQTGESLVELVKATMWAGGNVVGAARTGAESDAAELCLELLVTLALRNRDRVALLWPLVHEYLAACTAPEAEGATPLVERAVLGLLRVS